MDHLAGLLTDRAELDEGAARVNPGLLLELPKCRCQQVLAGFSQTLGDGPGTRVPRAPEWPSRVSQEQLKAPGISPKQEEPGTG
jgi:hypothetical protein